MFPQAPGAGVRPLGARLLYNRGLRDEEEALAFLNPELSQLGDPFALPDMERHFPDAPVAVTEGGHFLQEEVPTEIAAAAWEKAEAA